MSGFAPKDKNEKTKNNKRRRISKKGEKRGASSTSNTKSSPKDPKLILSPPQNEPVVRKTALVAEQLVNFAIGLLPAGQAATAKSFASTKELLRKRLLLAGVHFLFAEQVHFDAGFMCD